MPVVHHLVELSLNLSRSSHHLSSLLSFHPSLTDTKHYGELFCLTSSKIQIHLKRTTTVVTFRHCVTALTIDNRKRVCISMVRTDELITVAIVTSHLLTYHTDERVASLVFVLEVLRLLRHIEVVTMVDETILVSRLDDVLRILQVVAIVVHVPVGSELSVGESTKFTSLLAHVGHLHVPHLELLSLRHEVESLCLDVAILRRDLRISGTVAALALVLVEWFAHRLPRARPEVFRLAVVQIDVAAWLIQRNVVELDSQEASLNRRAEERITSRVVGDDRSVAGITQVVTPRLRSVWFGNDVFLVFVVEKSVLHKN